MSRAGRPITAAARPVDLSTSGLRNFRRSFGRDFPYLNRAGWDADESYRFAPDGSEIFPPAYFDVQTLTVHHTVTANNDANPAATVRAIYFDMAVTQDFGDIGYHLLIDQQGTVYEGRYSGNDSVPVFGPRRVGPRPVDGHRRPRRRDELRQRRRGAARRSDQHAAHRGGPRLPGQGPGRAGGRDPSWIRWARRTT